MMLTIKKDTISYTDVQLHQFTHFHLNLRIKLAFTTGTVVISCCFLVRLSIPYLETDSICTRILYLQLTKKRYKVVQIVHGTMFAKLSSGCLEGVFTAYIICIVCR